MNLLSFQHHRTGEAVFGWARKQPDYGYAFGSVAGSTLERIFQQLELNITQPQQFSCGEVIAQALDEAGVRLFLALDFEAAASRQLADLLE